MRYKDGERIDLVWDDGRDSSSDPQYIKGHVTEAHARAELEAWCPGCGTGPMTLRHIYGRWVFSSSDSFEFDLKTYAEPKRGAFKITEVLPAND